MEKTIVAVILFVAKTLGLIGKTVLKIFFAPKRKVELNKFAPSWKDVGTGEYSKDGQREWF